MRGSVIKHYGLFRRLYRLEKDIRMDPVARPGRIFSKQQRRNEEEEDTSDNVGDLNSQEATVDKLMKRGKKRRRIPAAQILMDLKNYKIIMQKAMQIAKR